MAHLKRLVASKHFPIERKVRTFIVTPAPGPHAKDECIPMQVVLREMLHLAAGSVEVKKILNSRAVKVDGRIVTDPKFPVGLMDVIDIPKVNSAYLVAPVGGVLTLHKIDSKEAAAKLSRIQGKTTIEGGKFQLNLHDGRCIIVSEAEAKEYAVGDSVKISVPEQKILAHYKLKVGNLGMIGKGKYAGTIGAVKEILLVKGREPNKAILDVKGEEVRTIKDYIFIIGEKKAEIALSEK